MSVWCLSLGFLRSCSLKDSFRKRNKQNLAGMHKYDYGGVLIFLEKLWRSQPTLEPLLHKKQAFPHYLLGNWEIYLNKLCGHYFKWHDALCPFSEKILVCPFSLCFVLVYILRMFFTTTEANSVYEKRILDLRHLFWDYLSN